MTDKARLFIGSSVEHLDIAYAAQEELERSAEVTVWTQGIFAPSASTMSSLFDALDSYDVALFVFAPDDVLRMRGKQVDVARDNVVFELGLFIGRLGLARVFFLTPRDTALHLPTDLLGITPLTYDAHRTDSNLRGALGPACNQIRNLLPKLPPRPKAPDAHTSDVTDAEAVAIIAGWLSRGLIDVLTRPVSPGEVEVELGLPAGTVFRNIRQALSVSGRKLVLAVHTETRLQLAEKK